MNKVFCFGELLIRLSPELGSGWIQKGSMAASLGGAELNVARALSLWHVPVRYFTALPDNALSADIIKTLDELSIDTSGINFSGNRIGIYYLPQGSDMKNEGVIYDRSLSSFSTLKKGELNWDVLLDGCSWFHFSAIDPAVSKDASEVCLEGLQAAAARNMNISVDLNYRARLWQYGKKPVEVMPELIQYCNLVMGNIWAVEKMLGISLPEDLSMEKEVLLSQSKVIAKQVLESFPNVKQVAFTFRFDEGPGIKYYAGLADNEQWHTSHEYRSDSIIDKVGSGDCFMAALIYGKLMNWSPEAIIHFSAAAAFNKLFIKGDATLSSIEQIRQEVLPYA